MLIFPFFLWASGAYVPLGSYAPVCSILLAVMCFCVRILLVPAYSRQSYAPSDYVLLALVCSWRLYTSGAYVLFVFVLPLAIGHVHSKQEQKKRSRAYLVNFSNWVRFAAVAELLFPMEVMKDSKTSLYIAKKLLNRVP